MKKIVLIDGSPRLEKETASGGFIAQVETALQESQFEKQKVNVRKSLNKGPETDYAKMLEADIIIFAFPLYYFCLPGLLTRFLEDYAKFYHVHGRPQKSTKVYAIVNCGFPEPEINEEALRVIDCFSRHIDAHFRFGVLIGGGPMFAAAQNTPPVKKAAEQLDAAIQTMIADIDEGTGKLENTLIKLRFPRRLYFFMGGMGWKQQAKKNGLTKTDLYRKPYQR